MKEQETNLPWHYYDVMEMILQ